MKRRTCVTTLGVLVWAGSALAQPGAKAAFEVASVKPAAPLDIKKMQEAMLNGGPLPIGPHVSATRAEYTYMALRDLVALAYKVRPYQISGPDWISTQRFDIIAKYPAGASKSDAPQMLQTLLEERFKLTVHRDNKERPVLALVAGKGGMKLKDSGNTPPAIDESTPLKPGEISMDTADGPVRMTVDPKGGGTLNMGARGTVVYKLDPAAGMMHMESKDVTMSGFADTLSQLLSQLSGGNGRQVVDMTELKGHYEAAVDISLADLISMARAQGVQVPDGVPGTGGASSAASDPSGGTSVNDAVAAMGLKLESRKAPVDQLVIDHAEKTPIEN